MLFLRPQLEKLGLVAEKSGVDALIIASPENVEYFTGVKSLADATLILFYDHKNRITRVYTPLLDYYRYRNQLADKNVEVIALSKTVKPEDAETIDLDWGELVKKLAESGRVGYDAGFTSPLAGVVLRSLKEYTDLTNSITSIRMVKEDWEVEAIKKAVDVTIEGIRRVAERAYEGVSETELAGIFEESVRRLGIEDYSFPPIINAMPNNSYPHNTPTANKVKKNDVIVVDVGVRVEGRCSDLTRVIIRGRIPADIKRLIEIVGEALAEAIDHIQPGAKAGEIADIAVKVMEKHGVRNRFIHGLGHGIGVVVHEPPYLRVGSETILDKNMVFTIEPGLYIPGYVGVRVEEDVLLTSRGARVLSESLNRIIET
ncbi:M24 family metallopeptidase [Thermogladius sp. 4427co]|uniref:M24 family metallopeptidase n=1 Tax=Thermogladius sp. 4427co TaxID=3450718 RepID=UPI003F79F6ED